MKLLFTLAATLASMTVFAGACHADQYQLNIFDGASTAEHYAAKPGMQFLVAGPGGEVWPYVQTGGYICVNKSIIGKSLNNLNRPGNFITLYPPKPKNDKPRP